MSHARPVTPPAPADFHAPPGDGPRILLGVAVLLKVLISQLVFGGAAKDALGYDVKPANPEVNQRAAEPMRREPLSRANKQRGRHPDSDRCYR